MTEDLLFTCQLLTRVSNISKVSKVLYNYFYNQQSLTKSKDNKDKLLQSAGNIAKLIRVLDQSNLPNKDLCILLCKMFMKHRYVDAVMSKEGYRLWRSVYPEVTLRVLFNRRVPSIMRIRYLLGYTRIYNLVKRITK